MCIVAAKYFPDIGWICVKNRDRNYIPEISFKRQNRDGIEILLFWDDITQYCEGMNSGGVGILSASLMVKDDEKEITVRSKTPSKDGVKLKRALQFPNVKAAAMSLIKDKLPGNTLIFDQHTCYLLEGCWEPGEYANEKYAYKIREIPQDQSVVRTNHGVWLPWAGYQRTDDSESQTMSRISSECRKAIAEHAVNLATTPRDMIDNLAGVYIDNPQLNCLRTTDKKKLMRTTSQIMMTPGDNTFAVRPVQSHMTFNFWDLNHPKHKCWVEILSNKVLYDHRKEMGQMPFPKMQHSSE
jgi:hypothetical protein